MKRVLFLCGGNSARSILPEAFLNSSESERLAVFRRVGDELDQQIERLLTSGRLGSPVDSGRRDHLMETPKSRLRLEALIASPPTKKCREIIVMLEELVEAFPDQVRLDVYLAGEQPSVQPTLGYQSFGKSKKIPSAFINGKVVAVREAPAKESLRKALEEELSLRCDQW
ncbi:MAG: hypothetical protein WCP58_08535 [bacterium]